MLLKTGPGPRAGLSLTRVYIPVSLLVLLSASLSAVFNAGFKAGLRRVSCSRVFPVSLLVDNSRPVPNHFLSQKSNILKTFKRH